MIASIGLYLLNTLIRGGVLVAAVLLIERALGTKLAGRRMAVAWWILLALVVAPINGTGYLLPRDLPSATVAPTDLRAPLAAPIEGAVATAKPIIDSVAAAEPAVLAPAAKLRLLSVDTLLALFAVGVLAGGVLLGGVSAVRFRRWWRLIGNVPMTEARILAIWERALKRSGLAHVRLHDGSGFFDSPFCCGGIKKAVVFPIERASGLDDAEIEMLLAHELCHLKRRDHIKMLALHFVALIFWFNPGFLLCRKRLAQCWENDCDATVVASMSLDGEGVFQYARLLIEFAKSGRHTPPAGVFLSSSAKNIKQRIKELGMKRSIRFTRAALAFAVILAVTIAGRFAFGVAAAPTAADAYEILEKADRPVEFSFTITEPPIMGAERKFIMKYELKIGDKVYSDKVIQEYNDFADALKFGKDIPGVIPVSSPYFGELDLDKEVAVNYTLMKGEELVHIAYIQLMYQDEAGDGSARRRFYAGEQILNDIEIGKKYVMTFTESIPVVAYDIPQVGESDDSPIEPTLVAGQKPPLLILPPNSAAKKYPYASMDYIGIIVEPDAENADNVAVRFMTKSREHGFHFESDKSVAPNNTPHSMFLHLSDKERILMKGSCDKRKYLDGTNYAFNINISAIPITNEDGTYTVKVKLSYHWRMYFVLDTREGLIEKDDRYTVTMVSNPINFFLFENVRAGQIIAITDPRSDIEELDGFDKF